jgi:cyclase
VLAYVQPDGGWMLNNTGAILSSDAVIMIDTTSTEPRNRLWHEALTASAG